MKTISQTKPQVKDRVLSVYDQLIQEGIEKGMQKAAFETFKKGMAKDLSINDLMDLTGVNHETATYWVNLLKENPEAELPEG